MESWNILLYSFEFGLNSHCNFFEKDGISKNKTWNHGMMMLLYTEDQHS